MDGQDGCLTGVGRETQAATQIKEGNIAADALSLVVDKIEEHLSEVLCDDQGVAAAETVPPPAEKLVPAANAIREANGKVTAQTDRLENILQRLEI